MWIRSPLTMYLTTQAKNAGAIHCLFKMNIPASCCHSLGSAKEYRARDQASRVVRDFSGFAALIQRLVLVKVYRPSWNERLETVRCEIKRELRGPCRDAGLQTPNGFCLATSLF